MYRLWSKTGSISIHNLFQSIYSNSMYHTRVYLALWWKFYDLQSYNRPPPWLKRGVSCAQMSKICVRMDLSYKYIPVLCYRVQLCHSDKNCDICNFTFFLSSGCVYFGSSTNSQCYVAWYQNHLAITSSKNTKLA